jgi:hypothetical protein
MTLCTARRAGVCSIWSRRTQESWEIDECDLFPDFRAGAAAAQLKYTVIVNMNTEHISSIYISEFELLILKMN